MAPVGPCDAGGLKVEYLNNRFECLYLVQQLRRQVGRGYNIYGGAGRPAEIFIGQVADSVGCTHWKFRPYWSGDAGQPMAVGLWWVNCDRGMLFENVTRFENEPPPRPDHGTYGP